jgi:predicted Zn-dependent protease
MRLSVSVVLLASLAVSAQEQHSGQGVNFYSREREAALGAQLAQQLRQRTTALDSVTVQDFVDQIGRKLAAHLPGAGISYTFAVVADEMGGSTHEPASIPGGYIFVPAVLILTARDEAEFAGMLAHAMAHVAARHGTRQANRGEMVNMANVPLVFAGGWTGLAGDGQEAAVPISFLTLQRAYEAEADMVAVKITSGAGYDPESLVRYISRTQTDDALRSKVFSALPMRESRIGGMHNAIPDLPPGTYSSSDQFPIIQREVHRLTPNHVRSVPSLLHPR